MDTLFNAKTGNSASLETKELVAKTAENVRKMLKTENNSSSHFKINNAGNSTSHFNNADGISAKVVDGNSRTSRQSSMTEPALEDALAGNLNTKNSQVVADTDTARFYNNDAQKAIDQDWYTGKSENLMEDIDPRWVRGLRRVQERELLIEDKSTGPITVADVLKELHSHAGANVLVIDASLKCDHVESVVIVEGNSAAQVYSLADSIRRLAKNRYVREHYLPDHPVIQGKDTLDWMVIDLGSIVVHAMTPESRKLYNLEGVWDNSSPFDRDDLEDH